MEQAKGRIAKAISIMEQFRTGQIIHQRVLPASPPKLVSATGILSQNLLTRLSKIGIRELFVHQAETYQTAKTGQDLVLSAPTANGKSLSYMLPLADALEADRSATAIYISPAKALAQQQFTRFQSFVNGVPVSMYDGDTPKDARKRIRDEARVIFTNPDMLHVGIIPYHSTWRRFLGNLRYIVLDESHLYTGAFGSHVSQIMRRLTRVAKLYWAKPTFILLSATVGNPAEHSRMLVGRDVQLIQAAGGGKGDRHFLLWHTAGDLGVTGHSQASVRILTTLVQCGLKTILFGGTRQGVERMYKDAQANLAPLGLGNAVAIYRSGYQADERRRLEQGLFSGQYLGVVATNALEVGIDVGDLDAVVMDGFPGTVASMWQQVGRAGRGESPALAVLVLREDALDQYFGANPDHLFERPVEKAIVNPTNRNILAAHLPAAAWEKPISPTDMKTYWGEAGARVATSIKRPGWGALDDGSFTFVSQGSPAFKVGIRGIGDRYMVMVKGKMLEETDALHALLECYPGAVYFSQGQRYLITSRDDKTHVIEALSTEMIDYFTEPSTGTDVAVIGTPEMRRANAAFGWFRTRTIVRGFKKLNMDRTPRGTESLELPPYQMDTEGFGLFLSTDQKIELERSGYNVHGSIHAMEHALVAVMPVAITVDRRDIGSASDPSYRGRNPTVFLYDAVAGGVGYTRAAFKNLDKLLQAAHDTIKGCECNTGCPSCIQSPKCPTGNDPLDKAGAIKALGMLLGVS